MSIKNAINNHPVVILKFGIKSPIAAAISMMPVKKIISVLNEINSGNIIDIPLANAKCPIAVNKSIADIPMVPDTANSKFPRTNLVVKSEIANTESKSMKGFILFILLFTPCLSFSCCYQTANSKIHASKNKKLRL